ncbi:MAG: PASTA domain-containing protein [Alistipes putredinis]|nr:MAG: PASTA domain-containing protein [Alistipes putredinis]
MKYLRKLFEKLSENRIARNIVLIICSVVIFCFVIYILLDVFTRHNKYKTVPDFVGTGISEARQMADKDRLRIEISDSLFVPAYEGGVILEQQPAAGGKVKSGRRIFVTVNSFRQKMVKVPYVTGYSLRQAKKTYWKWPDSKSPSSNTSMTSPPTTCWTSSTKAKP